MSEQTPASPQFLIGIDLGTTHTVVAYADLSKPLDEKNSHIFEVEQLIAPGEVARRPLLPSFRYHPAEGEINETDCILPWSSDSETLAGELDRAIIGTWARELGAKVDGRQVASAKSWLSHQQVDRSADILPWAGADDVAKVSPVHASASYLFHVRKAWNHDHPNALMEHQEVVITVPASFDEGARALTLEAAARAGLHTVRLLEEPQAVCYHWYSNQQKDGNAKNAQDQLAKFKLLMVCDVGGGTTDLSLIKVSNKTDNKTNNKANNKANNDILSLTRIGVGDHLMLGGDNVDLALAHIAEKRIHAEGSGKKLSASQLSQLIQQTRNAKERLLSEDAPDAAKVTVLGSGARLIGGSKSCELNKEEVHQIALDGFFPVIDFSQRPNKRRSAVVEFGLPYAADPAVSKHLAEFIDNHQSAAQNALELDGSDLAIPDAILFNGGVFNSPLLSSRSLDVINHWRQETSQTQANKPIIQLENAQPDLAVAFGAVAYAKARRGAQLKIGGGSARTFFLTIDTGKKSDGADANVKQAVCLMPKGTEEEVELSLTERKFSLQLGQPVQFHLLSTNVDKQYQAGDIIEINEINSEQFVSLPPLVVALDSEVDDKGKDKNRVEVTLATRLTEVGTLNIDCVEHAQADSTPKRWHVEFQIRKDLMSQRQQEQQASLPPQFNEVSHKLSVVFGNANKDANPKAVKTLRNDIEKRLGKRDQWEVPVLRAIFDQLLSDKKRRRRSSAHERVWFNLAGFGLRPGFGYPVDDWRMEQIWPLYQQGLQFNQETQGWIDWWTFWRRASGGLSADQQAVIFNDIAKFLNPSALNNRKLQTEAKQKSYEDMVKLVAALEHLPIEDKAQVAQWLLKRLQKPTETQTSWWALGRITSRMPFHGSAHNVIAPSEIEQWLPQVLKADWKKSPQAAFCAVLMCRMSGDRSRDINDSWRDKVVTKLTQNKPPASWIEMVSSVKELDEAETKRVFGEALPAGLKLLS